MGSAVKSTIALIVLGLMIGFYQNCAGGFKTSNDAISAACRSTIQAAQNLFNGTASDCEDAAQYSCEVRVFNPEIENGVQTSHPCVPFESQELCISTVTRSFNTAAAQNASHVNDTDFAPGGEYNRSEFRCVHSATYRGVALFEAEGGDLNEALLNTISLCRQKISRGGQ